MKVHYSADTHVGQQRQINQDAYGVQEEMQPDDIGQLMVLCDGMGGHMAGEVASRRGVDAILEYYYDSSQPDRIEALREAFQIANARVYEEGQGTMGTTGVALLVRGDRLDVANVGDSRAYLVRGGQIQQLTQDHSFVWEQVAAGVLTKEQARHSHYRNMITRAIGHRPDVDVDFFVEQVYAGDVLVLSSDGLHGLLEDEEIAQAVSSMQPAEAVQWLIDEANQRGGSDNITVIVARLESSDGAAAEPPPLQSPDEVPTTPLASQPAGEGDGPPPPDANAATGGAPPAGSRRAGLWGVVAVLLLVLFSGAAYFVMGGDAAPPLLATETPTRSPTQLTATPSASPTLTRTPTSSPTSTRTPTSTPASPTPTLLPPPTQPVTPTVALEPLELSESPEPSE
jgi:protein phosphatase